MITPLHALLIAEAPAQPVLDSLRGAGYDPRPHYVTTPEALGAALIQRPWDVVIAHHGLASLSVWDTLGWLRRQHVHTPVLVVADGVEEREVVDLIEAGANDVIGSAHLDRIGSSTAKALRRHREATAPRNDEDGIPTDPGFQALAEHMPIGLYRSTEDGRILYANPALARILGRDSVDELFGSEIVKTLSYPRESFVEQISEDGTVHDLEARWQCPSGETVHTRENTRAVRDEDGTLLYYEGTMEDITEERTAFLNEQRRVEQLEAIVRFSAAVDAAQSTEALHQAIVRAVEETLQADAAVLVQREDGSFEIRAWSDTISEEGVRRCTEAEVWASYPAHTQPMLLRDEQSIPDSVLVQPLRRFMRESGLRALGSFPLLYRGEPLGMVVTFFRQPHTFTEGELRIAETLAWHVAVALSRWRAECELRDSEASLRTIADTTGQILYRRRTDADTYDYLSDSIRKLTGHSEAELYEAGGFDALIESCEVIEGEALHKGPLSGEPDAHYLARYHVRTRGGDLRWVEDSAYPWVDETGHTVGLVGVLQDVTERRARERAAREQNLRELTQQRALNDLSTLDAAPEAVLARVAEVAAQTTGTSRVGLWLQHGTAGGQHHHDRYVLADDRHERAPDFPLDSVLAHVTQETAGLGMALGDVAAEPVPEPLRAYCKRQGLGALLLVPVRQQGQSIGVVTFEHVGEVRAWTPDEEAFAEDVAGLVALLMEHMRRARAESALRSSELRYRAISELAADYAYSLRLSENGGTRFEWATKAFERISGYTPEEVADIDGLLHLIHEDDRPTAQAEMRRLLDGHTIDLEVRIDTKAGAERWVSNRSRPVCDAEGRVTHVYSSGQDITERKRFETELIVARERAEEMARLKSAFLANMSHEIRTPLTGILGFAGVLADEVGEEHREFVQLIEKSGRRLLDTLNSVLDLAQLESDGVRIAAGPLDIVDEVHQVVCLLTPLAEEKGITLGLEAEGSEIIASLDGTCLNRILHNLVGNAIKFTEEGGVHVTIRPDGDRVRLQVADTGIGIDAKFLPHLFEEFKQESTGQGRSHEGSGLGLAITRKLVELMGGTIRVESTKGAGSTFVLDFPRIVPPPSGDGQMEAQPTDYPTISLTAPETRLGGREALVHEELPGEPAEPEEHVSSEEPEPPVAGEGVEPPLDEETPDEVASIDTHARFEEALADAAAEPTSSEEALSFEPVEPEAFVFEPLPADGPDEPEDTSAAPEDALAPMVLIVEDNDETRLLIERVLNGTYRVEAVADARTALQRMASRAYDALVLDINLGGKKTGVDVLRVARSLPGYEDVTAVALTAYALPGDDARFLDEGFDHYISKPFSKRRLLEVLSAGRTKPAARS